MPKISWPWKRCGCGKPNCKDRCSAKCGKTKTVKVLKASSYECKVCKYEWKVFEPELKQPEIDSPKSDSSTAEEPKSQEPEEPDYYRDELYDPAGSGVPEAPKVNEIKSNRR